MRFKVLVGQHSQNGKVYEAGDIVDSDVDLMKSFNNNGKFERVSVPVDQVENLLVAFKDDDEVTSEFAGCKEMNLRVYHENKQYFVIDGETNNPIHRSKITQKTNVIALIEGLK